MEQQYTEVPNIISGKDLDYLSDMFEWNYGAFKKTNEVVTKVEDQELLECLEKGKNLFLNNMETILNILNQGGSNE